PLLYPKGQPPQSSHPDAFGRKRKCFLCRSLRLLKADKVLWKKEPGCFSAPAATDGSARVLCSRCSCFPRVLIIYFLQDFSEVFSKGFLLRHNPPVCGCQGPPDSGPRVPCPDKYREYRGR